MVKRKENVELEMEDALSGQIPEYNETNVKDEVTPKSVIGSKIGYMAKREAEEEEYKANAASETGSRRMGKIGETIGEAAEFRDGWMTVDRALLGPREYFYPEDWEFRIKPATVEAIRNWSTIDEEDANSVDTVLNEIIRCCFKIVTPNGSLPWTMLNTWDRFTIILLIREYTFVNGENNVQFVASCPSCGNDVTFKLTSQSLMFDMPDESIYNCYDRETRAWYINPADYDVNGEPVELYLPTLEKDANIKDWLQAEFQQDRNKKFDPTFIKFLPWLAPKIAKDPKTARMQIRRYETIYKSWDVDMFSFMNDVLKNITVTPSTDILATCDSCGEEVSAPLRFPNGIGDLFNVVNKHRKFGTK